ncbi:MAG: FKBP-type peptidyl-prolyl cis-trans isomerase [Planctomycetota bacterium]|nr:MAG: FKBP-type peptidyl-prolyl cis-trans isomerase [Planctomycetota bacterium]
MLRRNMVGMALVGLMLVMTGFSMAEEKEVPFPTLPKGAGAIDEKASKAFTATESGLKYRILRAGNETKPTARQSVEVHYHGWLESGKVFDSSYQRGETISFGLNQVIKGWTEGMQLVGKSGMIELEIPGKLAYGDRGIPGVIPGNATLHFLVELKDIK